MEFKTSYEYEIQRLEEKVEHLKVCIGSWRRKAQDKQPVRGEVARESYNYEKGVHYKTYAIEGIPSDLPLFEVLEELKKSFLVEVYPYRFCEINYDEKRKSWLVKVGLFKEFNMDF